MGSQTDIFREIIVDSFAGGGGASTGIELATGRVVDAAINHDPDAILMHEVKFQNPDPGQRVLTMGMYGVITDAIYRKSKFSDAMEFCPFRGFEPLFWREIPELPKGVVLIAQ